jgi:ABC-type bacteriocin/lantibiotic exporter with double-glycine peptidase domain
MTITFSAAAIFAGFMRLLLLRVSIFLSNIAAAEISNDIYNRTLYQPYSVHISRSSSEIIAGITQKVSTVVRVLMSIVTVITSTGLFVAIIGGLIYINPRIAIIAAVVFGSAYIFTAWIVHQRLLDKGKDISTDHVLMQCCKDIELDTDIVARASDPEVKAKLQAATAEAIANGVFGAPTSVVNGHLFWGQDRLDMVEKALGGWVPPSLEL